MELCERKEAVLKAMESERIDTLVVASSGWRLFDRPDPVVVLVPFQSLGPCLLILRADGSSRYVTSPAWDAERLEKMLTGQEAVAVGDVFAVLAADLADGVPAGRIGVVGMNNLPAGLAARLTGVIGEGVKDFDTTFYAGTGPKTKVQVARAREATRIAELGYERLLEVARPGVPECEVAVQCNLLMKELGCQDSFSMLNAGPNLRGVAQSSGRRIEVGDIILSELSPGVEGQHIQICRTTVVGPASQDRRNKYDLLVRAMWAGIEEVRPGVPMATVSNAVDRVLIEAGFGDYCRSPYMNRRGHGCGTGSLAPGNVDGDNQTLLAEDMVFVVHPNQWLPGVDYMMCGEPVAVTAGGREVLSKRTSWLAELDV